MSHSHYELHGGMCSTIELEGFEDKITRQGIKGYVITFSKATQLYIRKRHQIINHYNMIPRVLYEKMSLKFVIITQQLS